MHCVELFWTLDFGTKPNLNGGADLRILDTECLLYAFSLEI